MATIDGDAQVAWKLSKLIIHAATKIDEGIKDMRTAQSTIDDAFKDEGVNEVDEMITTIRSSMAGVKEPMKSVCGKLENYADYIVSLKKTN